jgi:hypothetical protein
MSQSLIGISKYGLSQTNQKIFFQNVIYKQQKVFSGHGIRRVLDFFGDFLGNFLELPFYRFETKQR